MHRFFPRSILAVLLLFSVVQSQLTPTWPTTYNLRASTILQVCNTTGPVSADVISRWGVLDFDWSTSKQEWCKTKPMTAEESLLAQGLAAHTARPDAIIGTYRNSIKALPWFTTVRVKLEDPSYRPWFLPFGPPTVNGSAWHVPACDTNYDPPLCSSLYHDQTQTPGFPSGDGNCAPPACDVGTIPVGEYLFDFRASGLSINGQTLLEWFVDDYLFGPTGGGSNFTKFFFLDDGWTPIGPSEFDNNAVFDMGLSVGDVETIFLAYLGFMAAVQVAILERGALSWQLMYTDGLRGIWGNTCAGPLVGNSTCEADLRILCAPDSPTQRRTIMYGFSPGECETNPSALPNPRVDIANFLLIRGDSAFIGHGWLGCDVEFEWPVELDLYADVGYPEGLCSEISRGIFSRNFTNLTVTMDCTTGKPIFEPR